MNISAIYRYPVKSMGGHALTQTTLGARGIPGDRCWTLKDEARGGIKGGKRFPVLMDMQASLTDEPQAARPSPPATITLPDGTRMLSTDPDANERLSAAVGAPVSIWPLLPGDQLDHYRRPPPEPDQDMEAGLREVFARTPDEPLPDLSAFPQELFTYESPPGTYFDAFPLLIMTQSSLDSMTAARPESVFDVRRFRPNVVIDLAGDGFAENRWAGRSGRLGGARVKFEMACPRCVMTTHGFGDLARDPGIMRALVQANEGNLGMYANVTDPGEIRVGDVLELDP